MVITDGNGGVKFNMASAVNVLIQIVSIVAVVLFVFFRTIGRLDSSISELKAVNTHFDSRLKSVECDSRDHSSRIRTVELNQAALSGEVNP